METVQNIKISDELKARYDKLFQDGFLVNLHISIWGMGAQLSKEDLKIQDAVPNIFRLGKKMIIEPKHFNSFKNHESKARRYLYQNSYPFHISEAHFIPKRKLLDVLSKLDEFKIEFKELVVKFIENYPTYKDEILAAYPDVADALRPFYPTTEQLQGKFKFSVVTYELKMPRELGEVDIQQLISRDEAKAEVKKKLETQMEEQYLSAMRQLDKFTEDAAQALRQQIGDVCQTIIDKIKNKEIISKSNINSIKEEIENFKALNFLDDAVVSEEIDKLERLINGNHNFKTDQETIAELNTALSDVLKTASETSDLSDLRGTYFRAIKL